MFKVIAVIALIITLCSSIPCTPNICQYTTCKEPNCTETQSVVPKGSICGCCNICMTILNEGDDCDPLVPPMDQKMCGKKLECSGIDKKCRRIKDL